MDYAYVIMPRIPRYHLVDYLRPQAHFYLERQRMNAGPAAVPPIPPTYHRHDYLELFWVESGQGWEYRDDGRYRLDPGRLVVLTADDAHGFGVDADDVLVIWNLAFPVEDWQQLQAWHGGEIGDWFTRPASARRLRLRPQEAHVLNAWAEAQAVGARRRVDLVRLLLELDYLLGSAPRTEVDPLPAWLTEALIRVREPRWFALGPSALVQLSGCSSAHVARTVRRHLGITPTTLINEARLQWAAARLVDSDETILAICYSCGWQNLGCFYRTFRRRFATTPQAWRRRARSIACG